MAAYLEITLPRDADHHQASRQNSFHFAEHLQIEGSMAGIWSLSGSNHLTFFLTISCYANAASITA